jgi:hypothetical protein
MGKPKPCGCSSVIQRLADTGIEFSPNPTLTVVHSRLKVELTVMAAARGFRLDIEAWPISSLL